MLLILVVAVLPGTGHAQDESSQQANNTTTANDHDTIEALRAKLHRAETELQDADRRLDQLEEKSLLTVVPIKHPDAVKNLAADTICDVDSKIQEASLNWDEVVRKDPKSDGFFLPWSGATYKIGGFIKADLIHDFDAIGDTDKFDVGTIPTDGRKGENTRAHARLTRFNLDVRWPTKWEKVRTFGEVDFFGANSVLRLRQAYGEIGPFLAGQTWSTFVDPDIIPAILDNESSESGVFLTRPAIFRWTRELRIEGLTAAIALEDPASTSTVVPPAGVIGQVENPWPDLIGRFRFVRDWGHLQSSAFVGATQFRELAGSTDEETVWGFNFTGSWKPTECDTIKFQIAFGDGLSRYDGTIAVVPDLNGNLVAIPAVSWSVALEHEWNKKWSSTVAYSNPRRDPIPGEPANALRTTQYLAANLVWNPVNRTYFGVEYLFGSREDINGARGDANRIMFTVRYKLP